MGGNAQMNGVLKECKTDVESAAENSSVPCMILIHVQTRHSSIEQTQERKPELGKNASANRSLLD